MNKYTLYHGDCLEFMRGMEAGSVDAVITDPPYGTGERLRIEGEFVNTKQEWDTWSMKWFDFLGDCPVAFFIPSSRLADGLKYAPRLLSWVSANPIAKKGVSPRYGIQPILARGPFPMQYGLDWFKHRNNIQTPEHPHQKPLPVMKWLIQTMTEPEQTVFDPFMGSGTTGVACLQLGRNFIGCEIDAKYFEIAKRRIERAALQEPLFV